MPITPDTKDWTWVLERPCRDCGFDALDYPLSTFATTIRENAATWLQVLTREEVRRRPGDDRWSDLEYACHVRDVYRVFDQRLALMLNEDDPQFQNWDQDETALAERYEFQEPLSVGVELVNAANVFADRYDTVTDAQWERRGRRSNGSRFSVASLGWYSLHDVHHHLWDVEAT